MVRQRSPLGRARPPQETEHTRRPLRLTVVGRRLLNRKGNSNSRRSTLKIMRRMTTLKLIPMLNLEERRRSLICGMSGAMGYRGTRLLDCSLQLKRAKRMSSSSLAEGTTSGLL